MTDEKKERLEVNDLPVEEELTDEEQKQTKGGISNSSPLGRPGDEVGIANAGPVSDQLISGVDSAKENLNTGGDTELPLQNE